MLNSTTELSNDGRQEQNLRLKAKYQRQERYTTNDIVSAAINMDCPCCFQQYNQSKSKSNNNFYRNTSMSLGTCMHVVAKGVVVVGLLQNLKTS